MADELGPDLRVELATVGVQHRTAHINLLGYDLAKWSKDT